MKKSSLIFTLLMFISFGTFAQKPKKIFSSLQEGNLREAESEYNKLNIEENKYSVSEDILLDLSKCLLLIEPTSRITKYNPIQSIEVFNAIFIPFDIKEDIIKFLSKYELDLEKISDRIYSEIVIEAKNLNTVESYSSALKVSSEDHRLELLQLQEEAVYISTIVDKDIKGYKAFLATFPQSKYKYEIQSLLERSVLDIAINNQVVGELNLFIKEYFSSSLKQEATDFRDSLVLSKVPNEYDSLLAFTRDYPNSKFIDGIQLKLPDLLYEFNFLDTLMYKKSINSNSYFALKSYANNFPNGFFIDTISKIIDLNYKINDNIYLENGMKIVHEEINWGDIEFDWDKDNIFDKVYHTQYIDTNYLLFFLTKSKKSILIQTDDFLQRIDQQMMVNDENGELIFTLHNSHNQYLTCDSQIKVNFNTDLNNFELTYIDYSFYNDSENIEYNIVIDLLSKKAVKNTHNVRTDFIFQTKLNGSILFIGDDINVFLIDFESLLELDGLGRYF
jgi:hypothetical protein